MSNLVKLSQFKMRETKKIAFSGIKTDVVYQNEIDGEIEFYELSIELIEKITKEIMPKLQSYENYELLYNILPYICNIDIDITYIEFEGMLMMSWKTNQLKVFIEEVNVTLKTIMESVYELVDSYQKLDKDSKENARNEYENKLLEEYKIANNSRKIAIIDELKEIDELRKIDDI